MAERSKSYDEMTVWRGLLSGTAVVIGAIAIYSETQAVKDTAIAETLREYSQSDKSRVYDSKAHDEEVVRNIFAGAFMANLLALGIAFAPFKSENPTQQSEALRNL